MTGGRLSSKMEVSGNVFLEGIFKLKPVIRDVEV